MMRRRCIFLLMYIGQYILSFFTKVQYDAILYELTVKGKAALKLDEETVEEFLKTATDEQLSNLIDLLTKHNSIHALAKITQNSFPKNTQTSIAKFTKPKTTKNSLSHTKTQESHYTLPSNERLILSPTLPRP
jgi:hypothetical protein